jgi:hypothetical protein
MPLCAGDEALGEAPGGGSEGLVQAGRLEFLQSGQAGGHRQRVARKRAGLIDGAERGDLFHDLAAAAKGAERQATTHDLAEGGQVGCDAIQPLRRSRADAKAGHHFIENQHRAMACA